MRVAEGLFDERLHPRDRDGEWAGVGGARLRRVVADTQRLQRVHSKLRLRLAGGEDHLAVQVDVLGRARREAEDELAAHGYHLTPMGKPVRIGQPTSVASDADNVSFWDARIAETRAALAAATDPMDRAMLGRHLQRLTGSKP